MEKKKASIRVCVSTSSSWETGRESGRVVSIPTLRYAHHRDGLAPCRGRLSLDCLGHHQGLGVKEPRSFQQHNETPMDIIYKASPSRPQAAFIERWTRYKNWLADDHSLASYTPTDLPIPHGLDRALADRAHVQLSTGHQSFPCRIAQASGSWLPLCVLWTVIRARQAKQ